MCGYLCGLAFGIWIGIGALMYPPISPRLTLSTDGCLADMNYASTTDIPVEGYYTTTGAAFEFTTSSADALLQVDESITRYVWILL